MARGAKTAPQRSVTQPTPVPRRGRSSKTKARDTIKVVTSASRHIRKATPPLRGSPSPPRSRSSRTSTSSNAASLSSTRSAHSHRLGSEALDRLVTVLERGFKNVGRQIRQSNYSTFEQLVEHLDGALGKLGSPSTASRGGEVANTGTYTKSVVTTTTPSAVNVLKRWSWVEQAIVDSISDGTFDINNLPKLHREEDPRNRHLKSTIKGGLIPFNKNEQPEVIVGETKMHKAFKDPYTFFSAWEVYVSIRTAYAPERAPGLALFNERIFHMLQLNYSWHSILNYILAFFRKYQDSIELGIWDDVEGTLVANHVTLTQQKPSSSTDTLSKSKPTRRNVGDTEISNQICLNWNRKNIDCKGCQRRHVCSICENDDHGAFLPCPSKR
jgi:hypothetical protein